MFLFFFIKYLPSLPV